MRIHRDFFIDDTYCQHEGRIKLLPLTQKKVKFFTPLKNDDSLGTVVLDDRDYIHDIPLAPQSSPNDLLDEDFLDPQIHSKSSKTTRSVKFTNDVQQNHGIPEHLV